MTKEGYQNRIKIYLERKKVRANAASIKRVVNECYGSKPASEAVLLLLPKTESRSEKRQAASQELQKVIEAACVVFGEKPSKISSGESANFRDLRSAICFIALHTLKIRPAVAVSEALGLKTPATAYHKAYRAETLIKERALFAQAIKQIEEVLV